MSSERVVILHSPRGSGRVVVVVRRVVEETLDVDTPEEVVEVVDVVELPHLVELPVDHAASCSSVKTEPETDSSRSLPLEEGDSQVVQATVTSPPLLE